MSQPNQYEDKDIEVILDKARWGDYQKEDGTWSHGISNKPELLQLITQKQLEARIEGAIDAFDTLIKLNGMLRQEPSSKQLHDQADKLRESLAELKKGLQ